MDVRRYFLFAAAAAALAGCCPDETSIRVEVCSAPADPARVRVRTASPFGSGVQAEVRVRDAAGYPAAFRLTPHDRRAERERVRIELEQEPDDLSPYVRRGRVYTYFVRGRHLLLKLWFLNVPWGGVYYGRGSGPPTAYPCGTEVGGCTSFVDSDGVCAWECENLPAAPDPDAPATPVEAVPWPGWGPRDAGAADAGTAPARDAATGTPGDAHPDGPA